MRSFVAVVILLVLTSVATAEAKRAGCDSDAKLDPDKRADVGAAVSTASVDHFYDLSKQMRRAFDGPSPFTARPIAEDYLRAAKDFPCDWNYGNAIHNANVVLGLLALREGRRADAAAYLRAAGASPGSPQLDSFGPSLLLARDLARQGEYDAVADYLTSVKRFWKAHDDSLVAMLLPMLADPDPMATWIAQLRKGREPNFSFMQMHSP